MTVILKDEVRVARKPYVCDAYAWWCSCTMRPEDCESDAERLIVSAAESDGGKVLPGQQYRYARVVHEGRMSTWRERLDMGALCRAHGLYDE